MECFKPLYVSDPRYPNERTYISVPCRKCAACVANRKNDWARRLVIESSAAGLHYFVTLTYAVEPLTYNKLHIQEFIKKLRSYEKNIRYFIVGERGSKKDRVHYHCLLFSSNLQSIDIVQSWTHGFGLVQPVTAKRCFYAAKYCVPELGQSEHFLYTSRKPALGFALTEKLSKYVEKTGNAYYRQKGFITPIPRYNRRKLKEMDIFTTSKPDLPKQVRKLTKYFEAYPNESFRSESYREQQQRQFAESQRSKSK